MSKQEKWRFWLLGVLMVAGMAVMAVRLANLQVRGADDYGAIAESSMTKTIYESGSRGQILDRNGVLLAVDKKIYNINFYRDPSSNRAQNGEYSKAIWEVIKLVEAEGKTVSFPFWLKRDESGSWAFDTGTQSPGVAQARENLFRGNFYVKGLPVEGLYDKLCENYLIHEIDAEFPQAEKLTEEDKIKVLSVWQEMQMNAFNSVPITLVRDVSWATVIRIETRLMSLPGISISVENQRIYPKGTLACHILGYTGLMQKQEQIDEYLSKGYLRTDTIGLDGVEKSMEQWLTANSKLRRGYSVVEVDRSGRKIRQLEKVEPQDGNTVKLTIDSAMQQVVETELSKIVHSIRDYEEETMQTGAWQQANKDALLEYQAKEKKIKLAEKGAIVVLDMNARVLGMASFPNFDPNLFIQGMNEEQRARMLLDERNPLFNNAIQASDTPGSVFKMCTALAALANGKLTLTEEISDLGKFHKYDITEMAPKCWIPLNQIHKHANQTVVEGLSHSCNYFFYTIASRLGSTDESGDGQKLYEFATKLGLTTKTNIDLPGEKRSVVGSQATLYDPNKPINGYDQDTWIPVQVKARLKEHLKGIGAKYNVDYSDERLDKCIKRLMDMAVYTDQGEKQYEWVRAIRPILMEELGMSMDMVWLQAVVGDIVLALNEVKWGGSNTIQTAIGQSITMTTPIAMARYVTAIVNGGYVYDVQLIDSIISASGETIASFDQPVLVNDLSDEIGPYVEHIKAGMKGVVDDEQGTATRYFSDWKYKDEIGGKTGTAEKSDLDVESNSWFVCFAPYEKPEIVVVVYVPNGMSGARSSLAARNIVQYYLESKVDTSELILPAPNGLAQ